LTIQGTGPITTSGNGSTTLTLSLTSPLPITNGGSGATVFANSFGVVYYDGNKLQSTSVGTASYVLTSSGPGSQPSFQPSSVNAVVNYSSVTTSTYTVTATDYFISVDSSSNTVTVLFPNTTTQYRTLLVKDRTGASAANSITITTPSGTVTFDGHTTFNMTNAFGDLQFLFNGNSYEIY
jgi:hypothetical protein